MFVRSSGHLTPTLTHNTTHNARRKVRGEEEDGERGGRVQWVGVGG